MAKTKSVYQTSPLGVFSGISEADESPLEPGVFLIPAGCVEVPPPLIPENKAAHWNGEGWQLVDYYEGLLVYSITTAEPKTITGLGPIPSGYTVKKPGPDQVWKNGEWVDDTNAILAKLYPQKLAEIDSGCSAYIEGGFHSSALGEPYRYSSSLEDQVNLNGILFSELDSVYPCYDASGARSFKAHTRDQLHLVNQDLVRFRQASLQQADLLKTQLAQALKDKKLKAMQAIEWTPPV
ncbi:tail fiber assembly protein [Pseudomonas chlororaphis subsp. aurantiaca]|uniref:hypothetical protein n=1 Tax=Pseudomonas chlororaphis TaxID=587753 RepID=UPI000864A294|nr:hypothetical protein [Pseudomonas chlororaphis]BAV77770.1 tail fiber assembly protein [Pseudomonas chlororaphis subsp. aurantiaca]